MWNNCMILRVEEPTPSGMMTIATKKSWCRTELKLVVPATSNCKDLVADIQDVFDFLYYGCITYKGYQASATTSTDASWEIELYMDQDEYLGRDESILQINSHGMARHIVHENVLAHIKCIDLTVAPDSDPIKLLWEIGDTIGIEALDFLLDEERPAVLRQDIGM